MAPPCGSRVLAEDVGARQRDRAAPSERGAPRRKFIERGLAARPRAHTLQGSSDGWCRHRDAHRPMPNLDFSTARAVRAAVLATLASALIGVIAWRTGIPFLFPALGASTFIVFALPGAPGAAPRNVV